MVDNGMPCVVLRAKDVAITGHETPEVLEKNDALVARLEAIRLACGPMMNLGDVTKKSVPKMTMVSKPENGGYSMAIGLGFGLSAIMLIVWFFVKDLLDYDILRDAVEPVGLLDWKLYVLGCFYWIFINSLLEEYVYRWFLVVKSEIICAGEKYAIVLSAMIFVVHHSIALYFFGFPWWANLLASIGLFIGGAIFSWLYIRYRSIWIPYITHAICDVTVFGIGAMMLF